MRALAVTILMSAGLARADVAGNQPVKTNPGITLSVQGVPGGIPIPISTGGGTGGSGGGLTPVQGVDGGYPVKVDQGAAAWRVDGSGVTQPVSAASLPLPTGAATDRSTAAAPNSCRLSDGAAFYKGTTPTDTQPVSGTFWQATQPVSIASMPSTPVTGTFFQATQPVSIAATVNTSDAHATAVAPLACRLSDGAAFYTGPLGTQLPTALDGSGLLKVHEQGTATVSGSGTFATSSTQLPAALDGSGFLKTHEQGTASVSGTVTANAGTNLNTSALALDATLTGGTTKAIARGGAKGATAAADVTSTAQGTDHQAVDVQIMSGGAAKDPTQVRALTSADTVTAVQGTGSNLHVVVDSAPSTAVTGTVTATQATGSNLHVQVDAAPTTAVTSAIQDPAFIAPGATGAPTKAVVVMGKSADGTPVYSPVPLATGSGSVVVSGTVTANAGSNLNTSALALDATLTGRTQKAQITDGTRDGTVKAGSTAAAAADTSVVVALHPSSPLPAGSNVIGHVIADSNSTTAVTGNVTVVQPTGTNLHTVLDTTSTTAVTQATGTNLHAVLDATSTTAVTQATGTNLHAVLDATSTTAVTQATASNLNATVVQGTASNLNATVAQGGTWTVQPGNTANTTAWKVDGSAVTQPVSTADTAPANQALGALNAACTLTMAGQASVGFQLAAGTLVGTIIPEVSHDNGSTYNATFFDDPVTGNKVASIVFGSSNTATDRTIVGAGGMDHVRVRVSAYTSGTAGCLIRGSATNDPSVLFSGAAGAPVPTVAQVGGKDGSGNVQPITMKAGSTAAAAADISAVVALHPSSPLPAGSNVIGHVITDTNSNTAVTGNVTVVQPTGSNLHAVLDTTSTTAVTQGTASNLNALVAQGAPAAAANRWLVQGSDGTNSQPTMDAAARKGFQAITDGTNTATVKAASTPAASTDTALVVSLNPGSPLGAGTAVIGHVITDTNSTTACTQATGTNLHVVTDATSVLAANQSVNAAQIGGTNTVNGGVAGTLGVGGTAANNAAINQNPLLMGAEAQSGTPAAATTGNQRQVVANLDGVLFSIAGGPNRWSCGLNGQAASLAQCQAAPAAGTFLYVDSVYVQGTTATAGTYAISCGTGSNCGTTNVALFPVSGTGNRWTAPISTSPIQTIAFNPPLKCPTAAQELCVIGTATNTVSVQVEGHTGH